jgi:hypothetical protein
MAYQSNLMGDFWRGYKQKRIGTGMPLSQNEMTGLMSPMLAYDAQRADAASLREQQASEFNRKMNLAEQAQKDQANANMVGGVTQMAMLPMAYQSGKSMGWWGGSTAPSTVAPATTPNLLAGAPASNVAAYSAQGSVGAAGTGAAGAAGGAQAAVVPMANAAPYAAAPALSYGAGGEVGAGLGSSGGLMAGEGGAAGVGALGYTGVGAAGLLGGMGGHYLADKISPIGGEKEKRIGGSIIGGAAAGAAVGSVVPGIGTLVGGVIGGIIGGISSLF